MTEIKNLKKEHKKLKIITKKATKKRLKMIVPHRFLKDSWIELRELKKLKSVIRSWTY